MLYHHAFLDHAFSFVAKRNPLVTAATAAPEGTAAAYSGDFSSKREDDHL